MAVKLRLHLERISNWTLAVDPGCVENYGHCIHILLKWDRRAIHFKIIVQYVTPWRHQTQDNWNILWGKKARPSFSPDITFASGLHMYI